jgi:putative oxidoreductase
MGAGIDRRSVVKALSTALSKLNSHVPLILRVVLGITMCWHGERKFFTTKISGVKEFFDFLGIPLPGVMAVVVALLELVGGIMIILGLATRLISVLFIVELLVAVFVYKYGKNVGFINGAEAGAELDWVLIAGFLALAALGAGPLSADHKMGWEGGSA